jgi:hypothetical protein
MECAPLCFVTIGFWCVSMQHGPQGHNMARSTDVHHVMASQQEGSRAFERWPTIRIGWMRCRLHRGSETEGLEGSNKGCVRGVGGGGARTLCIIIINLQVRCHGLLHCVAHRLTDAGRKYSGME